MPSVTQWCASSLGFCDPQNTLGRVRKASAVQKPVTFTDLRVQRFQVPRPKQGKRIKILHYGLVYIVSSRDLIYYIYLVIMLLVFIKKY